MRDALFYMKLFNYIVIFLLSSVWLAGQSINTEFGKNRVQFHNDFTNWWRYETENYISYWYGKAKNVAVPSIQFAELDFSEIQGLLEHRINEKIELIVYTDLTDLKQSNIGLSETFVNEPGRTKVVGNKIFVYFNGSHQHLRNQVRGGTATIFMNSLLFGNSLQEIVQNAVSTNIPDWYYKGMIDFIKYSWDPESDARLRAFLTRDKRPYSSFDRLAKNHPEIAGQSMWYYIQQIYGSETLSNLLYLSKINRSIESGFIYVLGFSFDEITADWYDFFLSIYQEEIPTMNTAVRENAWILRERCIIDKLEISPDGKTLLFARNNRDKVQVRTLDIQTKKETKHFGYGSINGLQETDTNYPLLAWRPDGNEISIVFEKRDKIYHKKINLVTGESITEPFAPEYQRVYSLSYINDLDFVISANTDGFSDLYYYKSKTRESDRITQDFYDDLDARYVQYGHEQGVLFSSNRKSSLPGKMTLDTILPIDDLDLYFLPLSEPYQLIKLGEEHPFNQLKPLVINNQEIVFLSDRSGVNNLQMVSDSGMTNKNYLTNFDRNIRTHNLVNDWYYYTVEDEQFHYLYRKKLDVNESYESTITTARIQNVQLSSKEKSQLNNRRKLKPWTVKEEQNKSPESYPDAYKFQSEFPDPPIKTPDFIAEILESNNPIPLIPKAQAGTQKVHKFNQVRAVASRLNFRIDDYSSKLDNSVLFEGLDSYAGERDDYNYTPMGILMKATVKDLFEDYQIEGGIRIPTSFSGAEYFLVLDDKKKRFDKRYALYRKINTSRSDIFSFSPERSKKATLIGLYQLKYPLDIFASIRATATLRNDRFYYLSSDLNTFNEPVDYTQRIGLRLEYVFDNTVPIDLNLWKGRRYKIYSEVLNKFDIQIAAPASFRPSTGFMTILGFDYREYISLDNRSIFAFRFAGATTFGSEKNLFFLGGMESWFLPKFDQSIPIPQDENFAYKTIAPNVRGFNYNIRNGNSFSLINSELRSPIFNYLSKRKIRYAFFRHFQLIAFFDAGMAWHGLSPYGEKNPLNSVVLENPPTVILNVNYFRDPLVMGYGLGVRTMIFGYFMRFDYAWGIETRKIQEPKFYISFGTDF